ncbi:type II toxin-antitoxin system RelE/ParE family toxin [Candidatus Uhrbacteria bacterium]|nr:type II toxin-antitoxin system RelE/ParE family toxin [Candidatus Uhrbacteria bacterium]
MEYQLRFKSSAERELEKIDSRYKPRILEAIVSIRQDPYIGKKLEGDRKGEWSYRVWPYRIIYRIYKHELLIIIIRIGHRQGVY